MPHLPIGSAAVLHFMTALANLPVVILRQSLFKKKGLIIPKNWLILNEDHYKLLSHFLFKVNSMTK